MTFEEELKFIVLQTNREHRMTSTIKGVPQALALLKHDLEMQAEKLGRRVNEATERSTKAFSKAHAFVDGAHSDIAEIESFTADLEAVTNGGPPLDPHPAMTDPNHTTRDSDGRLIDKP